MLYSNGTCKYKSIMKTYRYCKYLSDHISPADASDSVITNIYESHFLENFHCSKITCIRRRNWI